MADGTARKVVRLCGRMWMRNGGGLCPVLVDKNGDVILGLIIKVASPFLFKLKYFDILVQFHIFKFLGGELGF